MLLSLLGYVLLGLLLAWPLWRLLRWLGSRTGLYTAQWRYLRPYVAPPQRSAHDWAIHAPLRLDGAPVLHSKQ